MQPVTAFHINDLQHPVAFDDADEVLNIVAAITSGWHVAPATPADGPPCLTVRPVARGFLIEDHRRGERTIEPSAVSAACTLVLRVVQTVTAGRPDLVCLHAGAARIGRRLVVLPSGRRAGKSTLLARLASLGAEVFADDVLPIVDRRGALTALAPGIASRLRLPLGAFSGDFLRHCAAHAGPEDRWYRYLLPRPGALASYGTAAEPAAIVFLDRGAAGAEPSLLPATRAGALAALIARNFGIAAPADHILGRLERLARERPVYVLRYGDLDPAVELLTEAFGAERAASLAFGPPVTPPEVRPVVDADLAPVPNGRLRRAAGVGVRRVDGSAFLADDAGGAIFALDGIGPVVWELLAEPLDRSEIASVLVDLYPAAPVTQVRRDVDAFLGVLADRRLIVEVGAE